MSRKSIVIKMPLRERSRPEDGRQRFDSSDEERASPIPQFTGEASGRADDSRSGQWVSRRQSAGESPPAKPGELFDLAAERSLVEVAALSLLLPSALGWFWLRNVAARMRDHFD